jgi:hypothetical protein
MQTLNSSQPCRSDLLFVARVACDANRYEDAYNLIEEIAQEHQELTEEEQQILSVSCKMLLTSSRSAWRLLGGVPDAGCARVKSYRERVAADILRRCRSFVKLGAYLFEHTQAPETMAFYLKLKGDYYRYMAEVSMAEDFDQYSGAALVSYERALELSYAHRRPIHPAHLGLVLNFSVFCYEMLQRTELAVQLVKEALGSCNQLLAHEKDKLADGVNPLDGNVDEHERRESVQLLELLRDNLSIWGGATSSGESLASACLISRLRRPAVATSAGTSAAWPTVRLYINYV